jgi:8-oxo-dGTP pyrophosphatase MutT (NUDIX family)
MAARLRSVLASSVALQSSGGRRASVAMIVRPSPAGLECVMLRRAERAGDPWSGDVCLPGGRVEEGESDLEAAVRETEEECGLKLVLDVRDAKGEELELPVMLLGKLDSRFTGSLVPAWLRSRPLTHVSCFVFFSSSDKPLPFVPQEGEIAAASMVDLDVEAATIDPSRVHPKPVAFGSLRLQCPSVQLQSGGADPEWRLWGLTLGMTEDLAWMLGARRERTDWPPATGGGPLLDALVGAFELSWWSSSLLGTSGPPRGRWSFRGVALCCCLALAAVTGWLWLP